MTFWTPEHGATTPNSEFARTELREAKPWSWKPTGSNRLMADLRVVSVTKEVCVGQILIGDNQLDHPKPLVQIYYDRSGRVSFGTARPNLDGQDRVDIGTVPLGQRWTYQIEVTGSTVLLTVTLPREETKTQWWTAPSEVHGYRQYFKAGSYNQSTEDGPNEGTKVKFYHLEVGHS
jgi:hypothetical protein